MKWSFLKRFVATKNRKKLGIATIDQAAMPILSAPEIIELLHLHNKIKSIKQFTGVGDEYFAELYTPAINAYLETVQLVPASVAHHHAGMGGLAIHTMDVILRALRQRKAFELPLNGGPELIFAQDHYWTYAVFIGALLHDIGKLTTNTRLVLANGQVWNPHMGSILNAGADTYFIRFDKNTYKQHTQIANSFFYLIPQKGRGWIADQPAIFTELCAWLYGDYYEFGMIGQIVRFADRQSVAANLKIGGERERFNNAPDIPLIEKMMTALRELIETGNIKINGTEGSTGWTHGIHTYMVCGTLADKVRSYLVKIGSTDIPNDNTRLFDIWQEHGYAIATAQDNAIWRIKINNKVKLTVLKFETNRLFHPSRHPAEFSGSITILDGNNTDNTQDNVSDNNTSKSGAEPGTNKTRTTGTDNVSGDTGDTGTGANTKSLNLESENREPVADTGIDTGNGQNSGTGANPQFSDDSNLDDENIDTNDKQPVATTPEPLPTDIKLDSPDIGRFFIDWLRFNLHERKIQVNNSKALVHVAKEGALIVTPLAFKKFIWAHDLCPEGENITKAVERVQNRLRALMEKQKSHVRTKAGINIHTYRINGDKKTGKLKCWILPIKTVFTDKPPDINPVLENISGFENRE